MLVSTCLTDLHPCIYFKAGMLHVQSRCMHSIQHAFLRLQTDLDPMMKPVPAPTKASDLLPPREQTAPAMRKVPSTDDMHATNRIISHVLQKVGCSLFRPDLC